MALATKVYEEAAKENQANQTDNETTTEDKKSNNDDVMDADYEEK